MRDDRLEPQSLFSDEGAPEGSSAQAWLAERMAELPSAAGLGPLIGFVDREHYAFEGVGSMGPIRSEQWDRLAHALRSADLAQPGSREAVCQIAQLALGQTGYWFGATLRQNEKAETLAASALATGSMDMAVFEAEYKNGLGPDSHVFSSQLGAELAWRGAAALRSLPGEPYEKVTSPEGRLILGRLGKVQAMLGDGHAQASTRRLMACLNAEYGAERLTPKMWLPFMDALGSQAVAERIKFKRRARADRPVPATPRHP